MQSAGYELARSAVPPTVCAALRASALAEAERTRGWLASLRRTVEVGRGAEAARPVRAPQRRVHVQLPMCSLVTAALQAALAPGCLGDAACRAGLSRAAKLVELSVMIALPGAEAQQAPQHPALSRLSLLATDT